MRRAVEYSLTNFEDFETGEALTRVFDISSQSELKLRRTPRNKIEKSLQVIYIRYPNTVTLLFLLN